MRIKRSSKQCSRIIITGSMVLLCSGVLAQEFAPSNPLPLEPSLSGNYGELRPNHFHAGIDLKTAGREGLEVLAAADGFVSRIKISPYGYGKVIYIDHPEGYTTVYAHLQKMNATIEAYVKTYQTKQRSFEVDLYPGSAELPVKRGETIAFSGNTGGSGGPHLHFEIRETTSEIPRNPLLFGLPIGDSKAPVIEAIGIAPLDPGSLVNGKSATTRIRVQHGKLSPPGSITVSGKFGLEINGFDAQDGSYNQNGIYRVELLVNGENYGSFIADSIAFDLSRHMNALIDYPYYYRTKQRYMRLYRLPGNKLQNISYKHNGMIQLPEGKHVLTINAYDVANNFSSVDIEVQVTSIPVNSTASDVAGPQETLHWNVPYFYESEQVALYFPLNTVYNDIPLPVKEFEINGMPAISISEADIPVQESFEIKLRIPENTDPSGLVLAQTNGTGKATRALVSSIDGPWLKAESRSFGSFTISSDLLEPVIVPVNFVSGKSWQNGHLKFTVKDDFSGINHYKAEINGQWVVMEYEPKQDLMFIDVNDLPSSDEWQQLILEITDMAGNVATFEGTLLHP